MAARWIATWWAARTDTDAIPFGEIEGVALSDPSKLHDVFNWSTSTIVGRGRQERSTNNIDGDRGQWGSQVRRGHRRCCSDRRRNRVGRLTFAVSYLVVLGLERVYRSAAGLAGSSVQ